MCGQRVVKRERAHEKTFPRGLKRGEVLEELFILGKKEERG